MKISEADGKDIEIFLGYLTNSFSDKTNKNI